MSSVAEQSEELLKINLNKYVYNKNKPRTYIRTFQLRDSITKKTVVNGTTITTVIYHDSNKIRPVEPYFGHNATSMGQHYSTYKAKTKEYNKYVAQTVNEGSSGLVFGKGYWTERRPYFDETKREMKKIYSKIMKKEMQKRGVSSIKKG